MHDPPGNALEKADCAPCRVHFVILGHFVLDFVAIELFPSPLLADGPSPAQPPYIYVLVAKYFPKQFLAVAITVVSEYTLIQHNDAPLQQLVMVMVVVVVVVYAQLYSFKHTPHVYIENYSSYFDDDIHGLHVVVVV